MPTPRSIAKPSELRTLSPRELQAFAGEVRRFLVDTTSKTGGHIGANLGTVELTLALHACFDSPNDKILWDTGHQGYTHKIVTGRAAMFASLDTYGGMNRFVSRAESEHDVIEASHAGTSISIALGIALSNRLAGNGRHTIAVIGDGSLAEGLALEALNHAAVERGTGLILVLNDNGYAISPGFGALHEYLETLEPGRREPELLFSSLGLDYQGPIDGHDVAAVIEALQIARRSDRVALVHLKTKKGEGFAPADGHPLRLHFSFPFDPATGVALPRPGGAPWQDTAARVVGEAMARDEKIVAITPSTLYATGLQPVFERFPDRCFDPGMTEQHALSLAVGFAVQGRKPVAFYQSTFMQRAFDQLIHDVCFMNLPVLILTVRTGFAGYDNPTHHGIYDFAYQRGLPNLRTMYPKDVFELERMVRDELAELCGPTLIAMPYGPGEAIDESVLHEPRAEFLEPELVESGDDLLLVAVGPRFGAAREACARLRRRGISAGLVNLRYVKPLPEARLVEWMRRVPRVVTIEEGVLDGGIGSAIAALATDNELDCRLLRIGVPCQFVEPGSNDELARIYRLDADGIVARIDARWPR
ncbi:MAG: 1-deoxy-D-xylulose-5-phosphate synthase [Myxococcota bacterium]